MVHPTHTRIILTGRILHGSLRRLPQLPLEQLPLEQLPPNNLDHLRRHVPKMGPRHVPPLVHHLSSSLPHPERDEVEAEKSGHKLGIGAPGDEERPRRHDHAGQQLRRAGAYSSRGSGRGRRANAIRVGLSVQAWAAISQLAKSASRLQQALHCSPSVTLTTPDRSRPQE